MKTLTMPIKSVPEDSSMRLKIRQRLDSDYITCMEWVGPTDANQRGRNPGHCMAVVPLRDGEVPYKCPYGHTLPWYGTETG